MEDNTSKTRETASAGGFSVVMARKVLGRVKTTGLWEVWASLPLGRPSRRVTAYRPEQRIAAVVAGLACGWEGIGAGNQVLRPNSALVQMLGGRFPDQGTIHRWLDQATAAQAAGLRSHLHELVRTPGQFWKTLRSAERLIVDLDAQGMLARGARFTEAAVGYLGDGLDRGDQRYVASVAQSDEVLDEFVRPGNTNLMSELPAVLEGLNEVFAEQGRERVICRIDRHGGTIEELCAQSESGFHLDILRTSHLAGLNALHALVGLCWNLIRWSTDDLPLPPPLTPTADHARWVPARSLDLRHLLERASHCGLLLIQISAPAPLEAECARWNPESKAWLNWLKEPIQHRFTLAG